MIVSINSLLADDPAARHLRVEPYGSFVSGVYSPTSDVDLSLNDAMGRAQNCPRDQVGG